jgi:hypothetical protein
MIRMPGIAPSATVKPSMIAMPGLFRTRAQTVVPKRALTAIW